MLLDLRTLSALLSDKLYKFIERLQKRKKGEEKKKSNIYKII